MPRYEKRNVLTIWGHRGWHVPDSDDYNTGSLNRGYRSLNTVIQEIAEQVTVHSVSYSTAVIQPGAFHLIHVSAMVVYSGYLDVRDISDIKLDRTKRSDDAVFEAHL